MIRPGFWFYCLFLFFLNTTVLISGNDFHRDSLRINNEPGINKKIQKIPIEILKGIAAGDFKKLGWNEYVPKDAMEFQDIPLPQNSNHPRLISAMQIEQAKQNLNIQPYFNWYLQLQKALYNIRSYDFNPLFKVSNRIKMISFLYKIENNQKYLIRIEDLLSQLPEPPLSNNLQGGIVGDGWGDYLESAQAIVSLCLALDLVWYDINEEIRESTLRKMFIRADQVLRSFAYTPANNHLMVMGIALIEMAMLVDFPENYIAYNRLEIWNAGWGHLSRAAAIIAPDGGYGEGVDYARFILSYLAPFSVHLYNNCGIKLFENPRLSRLLNWVMANHKGNGVYAKFDDALNNSTLVFPLVIPFSSQGALYNKYFKSLPQKNRFSPNMVEAICVYRDNPVFFVNEPDNIQFYPDMGQVIFKDSFFNPEIFVTVLGERERWFADRHEHIDPLTIEMSAFGDDILIDPGYGQWTSDYNRTSWYTIPYAHNGILVDGLGTYRNPIWGDSTGCSMRHAFRTPGLASATISTKILDVYLSRKAYFINNKYLLLVDNIQGSSNHSIALNFNHHGNLFRKSDERLQIKNANSHLDVLHSSTSKSPAIITTNFGLQTPPTPAAEISTFKIEQMAMGDGYISTLMLPQKSYENNIIIYKVPFKGEGTVHRVVNYTDNFAEMEFAVNRGIDIQTSKWQSDSKVLFIHSQNSELHSILLIESSKFEYGNIKIESSIPITLYLEKIATQWLGYVEIPEAGSETTLSIEGIQIQPARFNHQIISKNKLIEIGINKFQVLLEGSGSLEFGIGNQQVVMPFRYHQNSNFLLWVKRKFELGMNYNNLSDYDKQNLKNHIVGNVYRGLMTRAEYISNDIFNNPFIFNYAANAMGLMQETIGDMSFATFDIPHRYGLEGSFGESKWKVLEDGMFNEEGVRVRNFSAESFNKNYRGIHYQYFNFFPEHQSHSVRLHNNQQNYVTYQFAETRQNKSQNIQAQYNDTNILINPGFSWDQKTENHHLFINGKWANFSGNLSRSNYNNEKKINGYFSGYFNDLAFAIEGEQSRDKDSYSENISLYVSPQFNLSQSMNIFNNGRWRLENLSVDWNYFQQNHTFRGRYFFDNNNSYQHLFYYLTLPDYYVSSQINLTDFQFGRENQFQVAGGYDFKDGYRYYLNTLYKYDWIDGKYQTVINQQVWIPLEKYIFLHPVVVLQVPGSNSCKWFGSGLTHNGNYPLFLQLLYHNSEPMDLFDYQFSIQNIALLPGSQLILWMRIQQHKDEIQNAEIRIQNTKTVWQPGLYYLYNRHFGSRLEGYLEWYW